MKVQRKEKTWTARNSKFWEIRKTDHRTIGHTHTYTHPSIISHLIVGIDEKGRKMG